MKITRKQIRKIIMETISSNLREGYMVPRFETSEDVFLFIDELEPHDEVAQDVVDPQSGEIYLQAGESPVMAGLVEDPDAPEETDADELDHYDWDQFEAERETENERKEQEYEAALKTAREYAIQAGSDFARDQMYDASTRYKQEGYSSPTEMVMQIGQDASGDMGYQAEYWLPDDALDVFNTLPDQQPNSYVGHAFLPSKSIFKDMMADFFYEGLQQGIEAVEHKYADA